MSGLDGIASRFADATGYANTATFGLPPTEAFDAFTAAAERWRTGRAQAPDYDALITSARETFARLVGVASDAVAVGSQVSPMIGTIAAALPAGAEVVVAEGEFTSVLFPLLAQERRGVTVRTVPLAAIAAAIRPTTDLVAVSAVQSANGAVADLDAIVAAAAACDARTLVDGTQAIGWLALDADRFDYVVCGTYKWLLAPRGTAFMTIRPERRDDLIPNAANWYAGADIWSSIYGTPLRLAGDARRFDLSPSWLCWVATEPALRLIEEVGVETIGAHDVQLANRLRSALGLEPSNTAIVSVSADGAAKRLARAGVIASTRAGAARLSFHLYNTEADADRAAEALVH